MRRVSSKGEGMDLLIVMGVSPWVNRVSSGPGVVGLRCDARGVAARVWTRASGAGEVGVHGGATRGAAWVGDGRPEQALPSPRPEEDLGCLRRGGLLEADAR